MCPSCKSILSLALGTMVLESIWPSRSLSFLLCKWVCPSDPSHGTEHIGFGHNTYLMVRQFPEAGNKIQSHFQGDLAWDRQKVLQEEGSQVLPHIPALCRVHVGVGVVSRRTSAPGLEKVPQPARQLVFQGQGLAFLLSLGELAAVNKSPAICTHQSCLLTGRPQAVFHAELHTALS